MKKLKLLLITLSLMTATAVNADTLPPVKLDVNDKASLQNGAELYIQYCHSCHSLEFQRYNITGRDTGMTDDEVKEKLIHTGSFSTRENEYLPAKVGDLMMSSMHRNDSNLWFGKAPPDLSTITRARTGNPNGSVEPRENGADYIYHYLNSFYLDDTRPNGVNNIAFPSVGMPHVLIELQGEQKAVYEERLPAGCKVADDANCKAETVVVDTEIVTPGAMTPEEYQEATRDIVNFLAYVAEPAQIKRAQYGPWVILFLVVFTICAYFLNREYWKDIK